MSRRFKSTITDWYAVEDDYSMFVNLYNSSGDNKGQLLFFMVTNSNEWQEITEPELIREEYYILVSGSVFRYLYTKNEEAVGDNFVGTAFITPQRGFVCSINSIYRKATVSEIQIALNAIRKHKGLNEGVKVQAPVSSGDEFTISLPTHYNKEHDALYDKNGMAIYDEGYWVEKMPEPVLITKDGYKVYDYRTTLREVTEDFEISPVDPNDYSENPVFYLIQNAQTYIDEHKPKYSDKDVERLKHHIKEEHVFGGSLEFRQGLIDAYNKASRLINELKARRNEF
jgi:hypothetical protein